MEQEQRTDAAYRASVDQRIRELIRFRCWYRQQANWGHWLDLAANNDRELRALLKVARSARRQVRGIRSSDHFAGMA